VILQFIQAPPPWLRDAPHGRELAVRKGNGLERAARIPESDQHLTASNVTVTAAMAVTGTAPPSIATRTAHAGRDAGNHVCPEF
jgi:hypothetical protein